MNCKNCNQEDAIKYSKYTSGEFCSKKCSKAYSTKDKRIEINKKVSNKLSKGIVEKTCAYCKGKFKVRWGKRNQNTCSRFCSGKFGKIELEVLKKCAEYGRKGGLNSAQGKRSKNEIYFAALCEERFDKVLMNEPMFNGWDADVIVEDFKVAVLWNGKWHYEKITESHSLSQVQNRDKIKIKEITNSGYKPYVIKDMGKENIEFVKKEFEKFLKYIAG